MIDNMIEKAVVGQLIGNQIDQKTTELQARIDARVPSSVKNNLNSATDDLSDKSNLVLKFRHMDKTSQKSLVDQYRSETGDLDLINVNDPTSALYKWWAEKQYEQALSAYNKAAAITPGDASLLKNQETTLEAGTQSSFEAIMSAFGIKYGDQKTSNLSGLQQGIQSITEEQAGALEGYMNGVSGQVYLHSTYLQQIAANSNVSLGTQSQMLLNLQNSYTVLMGLQQLLSGWSSQNERSVRVEIIK